MVKYVSGSNVLFINVTLCSLVLWKWANLFLKFGLGLQTSIIISSFHLSFVSANISRKNVKTCQ